MTGDMTGRVVAVTGGARGIGRATAQAFARAGARVAVGDLSDTEAEGAAAQLGGRALGARLDVSDTASFTAFLDRAEEELGPLDVLVNNAGVMLTGAFVDEADGALDRSLGVNVRGVLVGSRLAAQRMVPRRRGTIVNIASQAGRFGFPGGVTYCATKWAVVGASQALDAELHGTGVGVRVILPAVVETDLTAGLKGGRLSPPSASPDDVAATILRAVRSRRFAFGVPRTVTGALSIVHGLPLRPRTTLMRATGSLDYLLHPADAELRGAYVDRVEAGR